MKNIDPRIIAALNEETIAENKKMRVAVTFDDVSKSNESVEQILNELEEQTNEKPTKIKHFSRLNVVHVEASSNYIKKLVENPNVKSAILNDPSDYSLK